MFYKHLYIINPKVTFFEFNVHGGDA